MTNKLQNNVFLDLHEYHFPEGKKAQPNIYTIHPVLPRKTGNIDFDIYDYRMLFEDEGVKKIMRAGDTIGCFYIESPGMRSLLRRLDCDTFEMLTAASSVIRPGVAESGMMQEFIARHKDPSRRKYLVPEMELYLGETYGVMIYQEDVIKVAHHIAGLSLEEADLLRRAMSGKMRSKAAMEQIYRRFISSAKEKDLPGHIAEELWRQISSFAGYAFCKAHSASFALLSFQVAYLKVHYPAEFMASVLSNGGGYYSSAVYIWEAKRMGLNVLLPSVNESEYEYTGRGKIIRIGFMAVKGLSKKLADKIVKERNENGRYVSLADFIVRIKAGYEESALLIKCGAMEDFGKTRPTLMRLLDVYISHCKLLDEETTGLFANETFKMEEDVETKREYSIEEVSVFEYELLGYMVSRHPLQFFDEHVNHPQIVKANEIHRYPNKKVKMIGWYMASKRIKTKKGDIMKFLSLEDLTGTFEAVLFPKTYSVYAEQTLSMGPYLLEGKIDTDNGNNIIVEKMEVLSANEAASVTQKDSAENKYFGDVERVDEEEFRSFEIFEPDKLKEAYL